MFNNKSKPKSKEKFIIEIKTNKNGWQKAELLSSANGIFVILLKSGDIIKRRSIINIKFGKVKKIKSLVKDYQEGKYKHMKKKKYKKVKKSDNKYHRKPKRS